MFSKSIKHFILPDPKSSSLYQHIFYIDEVGVSYLREVYTIIDALGDLGGIMEITLIVFGLLFLPISRHSFYLQASRLMFFARSKDQNLFVKGNKKEFKEERLSKYMNNNQSSKDDSFGF